MFRKKDKGGKLIGPDDFKVLSLIGKGAFGKVWLVQEISTGKEYAMKVMSKRDIVAHDYVEHTNREREIMSDLSGTPFVTGSTSFVTFHPGLPFSCQTYHIAFKQKQVYTW